MSSRLKIIEYGSKEIILIDFSGASFQETVNLINETRNYIRSLNFNSALTLTDVTNLNYYSELVPLLKELTLGDKPYVKAAAVVGLSGFRKVVFNAIVAFSNRIFKTFSTREQALDWLLSR